MFSQRLIASDDIFPRAFQVELSLGKNTKRNYLQLHPRVIQNQLFAARVEGEQTNVQDRKILDTIFGTFLFLVARVDVLTPMTSLTDSRPHSARASHCPNVHDGCLA